MAQIGQLTIQDRAATPVNHVFTPRSFNASTGELVLAESTGVPVGDSTVTISSPAVTAKGRMRVDLTFRVPQVQTEVINGVSNPKVVKAAYANVSFNFDASSTTQERADIIGFVANSFATSQTMILNTVRDLQGLY